MRTVLKIGLLCSVSIGAQSVYSMPALESTQWLNHAELVEQLREAMKHTESLAEATKTLSSSEELLKASKSHLLDSLNLLEKNTTGYQQQFWGKTNDELKKLSDIVKAYNTLAYSVQDVDYAFAQYKSYDEYSKKSESDINFQAQYRNWDEDYSNQLKTALKTTQYHHQQFEDEEALLKKLQALSEDSDGQLKAMQTSNQLTAQQVRQMQMMRQLEMTKLQLQIATLQIEKEKEAVQKAQAERYYATPVNTNNQDGARF